MLRGDTKNVALNPVAYKDLDPSENFIPTQMDLRNIVFTDAGNMKKRSGSLSEWDVGVDLPIDLLIPRNRGYAVVDGRVFELTTTPTEFTDVRLQGSYRPVASYHNEIISIVDGGPPIKIANGKTALLGGSPPNFRFMDRIGPYSIGCGHNDTEFAWSNEGNPENWPAVNFASVQNKGFENRIRNMGVSKKIVHIFKGEDIELWYNRGGSIPFARSTIIPTGLGADYSLIKESETFYWLADDRRFRRLEGEHPKVISSPYDDYIQKIPDISDCVGIKFRKEHLIKWVFGTSGFTLVYDYKNDRWTEDGYWANGQFERLQINAYMEMGGNQYIGSYKNDGLIHKWSYDYKDDNGGDIRVYRRFKVRPNPEGPRSRFNRITFTLKRGVATSSVTSPKFAFRYRTDESVEWSPYTQIDMGAIGDNKPFIQKTGLGVGQELEVEIMETDSVELLLTGISLTARGLKN